MAENIVLAEMTWPEVQEATEDRKAIALVPLGATEAHGPHLPLATATYLAIDAAKRAAGKLKAHGVRVAGDSPELRLKMFVSVYGTDHDQTLIGVPAFQAPVVNFPVPELAFFKWVRNRGQAELRLWAFDGKGDVIVDAPHPGVGRSKYDDFTVLLFFGFSLSDVDKRGS